MLFFKSRPPVTDNDKARIEFSLTQIALAVGAERTSSPFLTIQEFEGWPRDEGVRGLLNRIGSHLQWDVTEVSISLQPQIIEKCGSGG